MAGFRVGMRRARKRRKGEIVYGPNRHLLTVSLPSSRVELDGAQIVPEDEIPSDVVTINSTVSLRDLGTNKVETYTLVYPGRADIANHKLSVFAPIGTAILGYRVGDTFRWRVPDGWRNLKVEKVIYQPERDGALRF